MLHVGYVLLGQYKLYGKIFTHLCCFNKKPIDFNCPTQARFWQSSTCRGMKPEMVMFSDLNRFSLDRPDEI